MQGFPVSCLALNLKGENNLKGVFKMFLEILQFVFFFGILGVTCFFGLKFETKRAKEFDKRQERNTKSLETIAKCLQVLCVDK